MSLALFKERIDAGEVDEGVRAHLRSCAECRAHYDSLALAARSLGDDGGAAARARLLNALPAARAAPRRWPLVVGGAIAASLAVWVVSLGRTEEVTVRGSAQPRAVAWSLRVYGTDAPGAAVHLIADVPGSKEVRVLSRAEVQYFIKPAPAAGQTVLVRTTGVSLTLSHVLQGGQGGGEVVKVGDSFSAAELGVGAGEICAVVDVNGAGRYEEAVRTGQQPQCATLTVAQ